MVFVRSEVCCLCGAPCSIPAAAECPGLITSPRPLHDPGRAEDTITSGPEPSSGRSVRRPAFHYFYSADLSSPGPDLLRSPLFTLVGVIKLNNANMPSAAVAIDWRPGRGFPTAGAPRVVKRAGLVQDTKTLSKWSGNNF